ncbi:hypothetical protein BU17DRAFT_101003 [Hysterangium stoloniferum]|nr:hypothetical protein BU17DRAFT_101003 [Hysterangium stoloniferum]
MSGSAANAPVYAQLGSSQDRRPLVHSQSSPTRTRPSQRGYVASPTMPVPEPFDSLPQRWYPTGSQPSNGRRYPTQATSTDRPTETWQFPEPQVARSTSYRPPPRSPITLRPRSNSTTGHARPTLQIPQSPNTPLRHKYSYSDGNGQNGWPNDDEIGDAFDRSPSIAPSRLSDEIARINLDGRADGQVSADGLDRFQKGEGDDNDWAWHLLVTKEARESLPPAEVMRQSSIFDLINGERSYVNDMRLVQEVFVAGLRQKSPPVINQGKLNIFIKEVFHNMERIYAYHQRLLKALFELQQEQHPIILSIGAVVLDTVLKFRSEYEDYIKHYPVAESVHRRELKSNTRYRKFLDECSQDPRLGKRDLITFISRPVTRLPRLGLQLAEVQKRTAKLAQGDGGGGGGGGGGGNSNSQKVQDRHDEHPDLDTIPILVEVLDQFVKSTQPGIAASENKVKFYALCESLVFLRGEIIDMDLYAESRTLVYLNPLARKQRSENWSRWTDFDIALLDNYLLITRPDPRSGAKEIVSRPIPLEYLRLGPFNGPTDSRREERPEGGGLFQSIIKPTRPMFPLVIYHASSPARRYTLYASSEALRKKWKEVLSDTLGVRKAVMDANKWFATDSIDDGSFRWRTVNVPSSSRELFTGKISSATVFSSGGKNFTAVATPMGIYVDIRGHAKFVKVLTYPNVRHMTALPACNKLIILYNDMLLAYSFDIIARVAQEKASVDILESSVERLAKADRNTTILFFRVGIVAERTLVVYATKSFISFHVAALEAVPSNSLQRIQSQSRAPTFRPYGEPFYVPKEPLDVTLLAKTIAVSTDRLMVVVDPKNLNGQAPVPIPSFSSLNTATSPSESPLAILKAKAEYARPIGIVRSGAEELIVVYDEFGCYVTKHAEPTRKCGYVRWETKATTFAERGAHILLFSRQFIEVRHVGTGRLVQVIEADDIRLVQSAVGSPLLIAMRGKKNDERGARDALVELVETSPIEARRSMQETAPLWDEWE